MSDSERSSRIKSFDEVVRALKEDVSSNQSAGEDDIVAYDSDEYIYAHISGEEVPVHLRKGALIGQNPGPKSTTEIPSFEEQPTGFASFVHDSISQTISTYTISHKRHEEKDTDRVFYEFDDGCSNPLVIVCFDTPSTRLVSVNKVVMPLYQFLSIIRMEESTMAHREEKKTTGDLRSPPLILHTHIQCTTDEGEKLYIPNTKVEQLMMALTVLGKDETYDPEELVPSPSPTVTQVEMEYVGPLRRFLQWLW
jgi:hypothetical protein